MSKGLNFQKIVLVSENKNDRELFPAVAKNLGVECVIVEEIRTLIQTLDFYRGSLVIWEAANKEGLKSSHRFNLSSVIKVLERLSTPEKVVVVDNGPLQIGRIFKTTGFGFRHFVARSTSEFAVPAYSKAFMLIGMGPDFKFDSLYKAESGVGTVNLRRSDEKQTVSLATEKLVTTIGLESRAASRLARAIDEFVMNAVFDAPRDNQGTPFRRRLDRKAVFAFESGEQVRVSFAKGQEVSGICVADRWGSIDFTEVMTFLMRDYETEEYQSSKFEPGAGLGLYGVIKSGLSFAAHKLGGSHTYAITLFPNAKSNKVHKTAFQFVILSGE